MKDFQNKVAVVTGAASGIGFAMAQRFAARQMRVVLADIEEKPLQQAEHDLKVAGANVRAVVTDVSKAAHIEALAQRTLSAFGAVHIVCNNAGVSASPGPSWERTLADWEWVLGVNLWSVIYSTRTFVPILLQQKTEGHVVNTASVAGLLSPPFMAAYAASKHAVVAISEALHAELALRGSLVKISVVCPGYVRTRIGESDRNRPGDAPPPDPATISLQALERIQAGLAAGLSPGVVADRVLAAIRDEQLYILTHPEFNDALRSRAANVIEQRNPVYNQN